MDILKIKNPDTGFWESVPALIGDRGEPGLGVPVGGIEGNILIKNSSTDYDTAWASGQWTELKPLLLDLIYPVGSLYWSSNSTNPATLFGGTWTQIADSPHYCWERTA